MVSIKESDINIYLIDDDELSNKILRTKFEEDNDYKIYSFASGEEFLKYLLKNKFSKRQVHIAILDYLLQTIANPHSKNGIDILKTIREINPEIEVIMLSGVDDIDLATLSIKCGAVSFVKKNENSFLRIQNNVKFIISKKKLKLTKNQSLTTRFVFFTLISVVFLFGIYYVFSEFVLNK